MLGIKQFFAILEVVISNILRGSSYLLIAQTIAKAISFFYTIYIARILGVGDFGFYVTALAYFALVSVISDFGFNRYLIRESARNLKALPEYLLNVLILRVILTILTFALFAFWLYLFDQNPYRVKLSILAAMAALPQAISLTLDASLIASQRLLFSAFGIIVLSLSTAIFGIYFLINNLDSFGPIIALSLGQLLYIAFLASVIHKNKSKISLYGLNKLKQIFFGSLPYGILGVLGLLYFRIDTLFLSYIRGSEETGLYGAGFKFLEAIVVVPSAFSAALFPVLARLHDQDLGSLKSVYFSSLKILGALSAVFLLGFYFIVPIFINILLPSYIPSINVVKILSFAIPFMFLQVSNISVLFSSERLLRKIIVFSILTLLVNIFLNLMLIPKYGLYAAAWITVFSELFSFIAFSYLVSQFFKKNDSLR